MSRSSAEAILVRGLGNALKALCIVRGALPGHLEDGEPALDRLPADFNWKSNPTITFRLMMTSDSEKSEIAKKFLLGLRTADRDLLESIMTSDVVWSLPGTSSISGDAKGVDAIHRRARTIVDHGMKFELKHILVGLHGVAASLHNTAEHGGMSFDLHLATVMRIQDGKVVALDTYMSDIDMLNRFFVAP